MIPTLLARAAQCAVLFCLVGILNAQTRPPWTTSHITGSPDAPPPYVIERVFGKLKLAEPLELVAMPGSDRFLVAEHAGRIFSFPEKDDVEKADLFADFKQIHPDTTEVYSIAFHPGFLTNRYIFIWYILKAEQPDGTHISRFKVTENNPPQIDPSSEHLIFTWKSGGHNGGCIRFAKDGYMYISTGDGTGPSPPDVLFTGQDISDVLSSILRIDVDHEENGRAYRIPSDNPFVNTPGARGEVWAYGLRNPWRMSFDSASGDLWVGDVGWELWEMIFRVERGGNYGWSILEGTHQPVHPDAKRGPTPILPPVIEHPHSEASSITGGIVYHGKRLPDLAGAYIYGDYGSGKIWELRYDGSRVVKSREIANTRMQVVTFGENNDGEFYFMDIGGGGIYRLVPNPSASTSTKFPRKLSETGLFSSLDKSDPSPGVLPYDIRAGMWQDFAKAERLLGLPGDSTLKQADGNWRFPTNAVIAKTLSIEMERGNPKTRRKIETQLLHFTGTEWNPYSYRWNAEQNDAELIPASGAEETFTVRDPQAPGGKRIQTWRFHSRAECLRCHNSWCNTLLAFNPEQLDAAASQLKNLLAMGILPESAGRAIGSHKFASPYDDSEKLELRARTYLHINCSHCHRENAGGAVTSFMNLEMPMERAGLLGKKPSQGTFGIENAEVIAPGDPFHSVLFYRFSKLGKGHMPYLGSSIIDEPGLDLIYRWIGSLGEARDLSASSEISTEEPRSIPAALRLVRAIDEGKLTGAARAEAVSRGAASSNQSIRDLFERFIPDAQRTKTLGPNIQPQMILSLKGDVQRGRKLFRTEGAAQCQTCHRAEGVGKDFGPDLSLIGRKYTRGQVLENILEPSKTIDPKFIAYTVETKDETTHSGFVISKSETEVVLKEATAPEVKLPAAEISRMVPQTLSLMPEGLLAGLTAQEAADLVEYLSALK